MEREHIELLRYTVRLKVECVEPFILIKLQLHTKYENDVLKNIFWCRYIFVFVFEINDSWTGCNRIDIFHSCLVMEINCKNIQGFEIWQLKTFWVTKVWKIDVYNFRFSLWRKSFANLSKALESSANMISESEMKITSSKYQVLHFHIYIICDNYPTEKYFSPSYRGTKV